MLDLLRLDASESLDDAEDQWVLGVLCHDPEVGGGLAVMSSVSNYE